MNMSAPFIERPIATTLLMVGLLLCGLVAYPLLPVASLPNVNFPTVQVTAQLPGADPQTMAASVATPLEQQFSQIPGPHPAHLVERARLHPALGAVRISAAMSMARRKTCWRPSMQRVRICR